MVKWNIFGLLRFWNIRMMTRHKALDMVLAYCSDIFFFPLQETSIQPGPLRTPVSHVVLSTTHRQSVAEKCRLVSFMHFHTAEETLEMLSKAV